MNEIFEPITLKIGDVNYEVVSEPSDDAKDTSKKIKAVMKAKGMSGKSIGARAPYCYKKDDKDKNKWIIAPVSSKVVKKIFMLIKNGYGISSVAHKLEEDKVLTPIAYFKSIGRHNNSCMNLIINFDFIMNIIEILYKRYCVRV